MESLSGLAFAVLFLSESPAMEDSARSGTTVCTPQVLPDISIAPLLEISPQWAHRGPCIPEIAQLKSLI